MKGIQITNVQATIAVVLAGIVGTLSPMMQRGLTLLMHQGDTPDGPPLTPNIETGFELVGIVTTGGLLLAWACFVSANRQPSRGRLARQCAIWLMPLAVGILGVMAAARLRFSTAGPGSAGGHAMAVQAMHNSGSASVAAIETFWLSAAVLAVLMLMYFLFVPARPSTRKTP